MGLLDSTVTNTPSPQSQQELSYAWQDALNTSNIGYQPYNNQLVAPLSAGQRTAVQQLQGAYGTAQPYIDAGAGNLTDGSNSLANAGNYLQAGSQAGANASGYMGSAAGAYGQATGYGQQSAQALQGMQPYMQQASGALGQAGNYFGQAASLATPVQFSQDALNQYLNPYTQDVINSTMGQLNQNDQVQASNVASSDIGSGAYGGDRNGIAQAALAGQQDLANNQTVAGLNQANYSQATSQFNQEQADRFQGAGIYAGLGQGSLSQAAGYGGLATQQGQIAQQYGNLGTLANQTGSGYGGLASNSLSQGSLYGSLGQAQTGIGSAQGQLGALSGYLGSTAQGQAISGASAGLQGSSLSQAYQQALDTANYGQFQNQTAYPYQISNNLANIANGQAANLGSSTTNDGSLLSAATGLGVFGASVLGGSSLGGSLASAIGGTSGSSTTGTTGVQGILPDLDGLSAKNGGRIGMANGGSLADAANVRIANGRLSDAAKFARGGKVSSIAGLGGINVMAPIHPMTMAPRVVRHDARPHFDNGGMPITFNPVSGGTPDLTSANTLMTGNPLFGTSQGGNRGNGTSAGGAGGGGRHMQQAPSQPSSGLGVLTGSASGSLTAPPVTSDPNATTSSDGSSGGGFMSKNASMGLMAAGLGMMSGTSGNGPANIGAGGLEGLKTYLGLQQQDRQNAITQQNMALDQKKVGVSQQLADQGAKELTETARYHTAQIANESAVQATTASQVASENAVRQAGLISTTPGYDPNTGAPGMWTFDRSNPSAGYRFNPMQGSAAGGSGGSQPGSPISFGSSPSAPNAPTGAPQAPGASAPGAAPVAGPGPAATQISAAAAAASVPKGPPMGGATGSWNGPTAPTTPPQRQGLGTAGQGQGQGLGGAGQGQSQGQGQATTPTNPMSWQATTNIPNGYVPPNQFMISMNPDMAKQQSDIAAKSVETQRDQATKAQQAQMRLNEMDANISNLPQSGLLAPGAGAAERTNIAKVGNLVAGSLGVQPVYDPTKVGDAEQLQKDTFRLGQELAQTGGAGGRTAGFIIQGSIGATPGMNNTAAGFKRISSSIQQANQYVIDRSEFMDNFYSRFGHLNGAEQLFDKVNPPQAYVNRALVGSVDPRDVAALQSNASNPAAAAAIDQKYGSGLSKIILGQ